MKKAMLLVLVFVLVFAFAAPAFATSGSLTMPVSATVLAKIQILSTSSAVAFGSVGPDETAHASLTVAVKSNKAYSGGCAVEADSSGIGILPKLVKIDSGAPFNGAGMPGAGVPGVHAINFSFTPDWTVTAGNYTANAVITVDQL